MGKGEGRDVERIARTLCGGTENERLHFLRTKTDKVTKKVNDVRNSSMPVLVFGQVRSKIRLCCSMSIITNPLLFDICRETYDD
jgi:hypothetical protein